MHAVLSPSGASKWINCPPSARLEERFPDSDSEYAKEGTLAHSLGALFILKATNRISHPAFVKEYAEISLDDLYSHEMEEYCEQYADFVVETYHEALKADKHALLIVETKLDLIAFIPEGFGTGDAIIMCSKFMAEIDLKYGKGVPVSAIQNKQLSIYGLGAYDAFGMMYDFSEVRLSIFQPRIDNSSTWITSIEELQTWADLELKPAALLAIKGEGDFKPGEHCRFCKAQPVCKAHAEMQLEIAKYQFRDAGLLEPAEISDILTRTASLTSWLTAINEYALQQALAGESWPGYKLVEGRSTRLISDEETALSKLVDAVPNSTARDFQNYKIKAFGDLEKIFGKKKLETVLDGVIIKPPGKPTLVPETDKRPAINRLAQAQSEFAEDIETLKDAQDFGKNADQ